MRTLLKETCNFWGDNANFAARINTNFQDLKLNKKPNNIQFFALTEQSRDFDKLNSKKILGLAQISKLNSNTIFLANLQVSPKYNYSASNRLLKKIGTEIVNSISKIFSNKDIFTYPATLGAEIFFIKTGFRPFLGDGIMRLKR